MGNAASANRITFPRVPPARELANKQNGDDSSKSSSQTERNRHRRESAHFVFSGLNKSSQVQVQKINENRSKTINEQKKNTNQYNHQIFSNPAMKCKLFSLCQEYIRSLGWNECFFSSDHDRCYCSSCYLPSQPDVITAAGKQYVIPRGYAGFGLVVDSAFAAAHKIWLEWIVTYHGTSKHAVESILANRQFLLPGDTLLDGTQLGIRPGHILNKRHIYTSPSINYSSLEVYSVRYDFTSSSGQKYKVHLVLQCRQKPEAFRVQRETVGKDNVPICNFILNDEIEYFTEIRASLIPYRLLVFLKEI